jgi:hypothetical protein
MWCVASISCGCAPLVRVTRVVALVAHHYRRSSFCFVHVVPNPRILPSSNSLAQLRIWIWCVHNIFFGVLSKRTLHEVILNCSVPNVLNRFSWPVKYPLELQRSSSSLRLRHLPNLLSHLALTPTNLNPKSNLAFKSSVIPCEIEPIPPLSSILVHLVKP